MLLAELCVEAWGWSLEVAEANVGAYRAGFPAPGAGPMPRTDLWRAWKRVDAVAGAPGVRSIRGRYYVSNKRAFRTWCIDARREFVATGDAPNREVRYG